MKNPIVVGLAGEEALCGFLRRRGFVNHVDLSLRQHGDGGADVVVLGLAIQVKTRRHAAGGRSLVRRVDRGRLVPLKSDVFVFAQWDETNGHEEPVKLLGWKRSGDLRRGCAFERSPLREAQHWNLKVSDDELEPMSRLVDELIALRDQRA